MVKKRTSPRRQEACPFIYGASQALLTFWRNAGASYYRARFYDPSPGRFVSEDPARFTESPNFYAYVGNNPMTYKDPFGQGIVDCAAELAKLAYLQGVKARRLVDCNG
jgi:RHS repeat-associated protein